MNQLSTRRLMALACAAIAVCAYTPAAVFAEEASEAEAQLKVLEAESLERQRALLEGIARVRAEAERAAEAARMRAEELRVETSRLRAEREQAMSQAGEQRVEQLEQIARMREDLSRTHRELRKAQREVAHANRDLALAEDRRVRARLINLGDRKIIGVILGDETGEGIVIQGVSPGGPAEEAGIQTGDILVSLRGESLAENEGQNSRATVYEIMSDVGEDEEIAASVLRNGERWDFMVKPERREPASWQTRIRLPEAPIPPVPPGDVEIISSSPHVVVERIAVPDVDEIKLAQEVRRIEEELADMDFIYIDEDGDALDYSMDFDFEHDFSFDAEQFSDIGAMAFDEARVWFSAPFAHGVQFAEMNAGLGEYFKTDHGALVLDAPKDNPFTLQPGDVVLSVGEREVNSTSDFIRALREYEPGEKVSLAIKRNKRDKTIEVELPASRFGLLHDTYHFESDQEYAPRVSDD